MNEFSIQADSDEAQTEEAESSSSTHPRRRRTDRNKSKYLPRTFTFQHWSLILGGLFLVALFYKVWDVLAPPVLALLAVYLMYPYRRSRLVARLMVATALVLGIWLIVDIGRIVFPFAIALILAYLFNPIISRLEKWRIPRGIATAVLLALFIGCTVLIARFAVPLVVNQLTELVGRLPTAVDRLITWVEGPVLGYIADTLSAGDGEDLRTALFQGLAEEWQNIVQQGFGTFLNVVQGLSTVFGTLGRAIELIAIPFITFYLLKDFKVLKQHLKALVPRSRLESMSQLVCDFDDILSRYIRGQLLVAGIIGVMTGSLLALFRIDYALILGLVTGVLNVIPYFGFIVSLSLGVLVSFFNPAPFITVLKVVLIYVGINALESSIISPRIVGQQVGLHPVWVIISLLVFFHFFGFLSLIMAVPVTAVGSLFVRRWYQQYLDSSLYKQ